MKGTIFRHRNILIDYKRIPAASRGSRMRLFISSPLRLANKLYKVVIDDFLHSVYVQIFIRSTPSNYQIIDEKKDSFVSSAPSVCNITCLIPSSLLIGSWIPSGVIRQPAFRTFFCALLTLMRFSNKTGISNCTILHFREGFLALMS